MRASAVQSQPPKRLPLAISTPRCINKAQQKCYVLFMNSNEFKRWLTRQGATFQPGKGSHLKVFLNGRQSVLPMHASELKTGLVEAIKKQLGLKGE